MNRVPLLPLPPLPPDLLVREFEHRERVAQSRGFSSRWVYARSALTGRPLQPLQSQLGVPPTPTIVSRVPPFR